MYFQVVAIPLLGDPKAVYTWFYRQGTPDNPGHTICQASPRFPTEREARSNIAATKKAFAAARMAKVQFSQETA